MKLKCVLSRDSVAAGDDFEPHDRTVTIETAGDPARELASVIGRILDLDYLPHVAGPACWGVVSGLPLALVVGRSDQMMLQLDEDRLADRLDRRGEALRLHFAYLATTPPELARRVMQSMVYWD